MLEENVFKIILKETWNEFFKHLSWFLLSLIELSLSWLLFRKNILRLRCSTNQIFRFNLRHKNRLTIFCYKSRFHWIFRGIFGIKNEKSFLILTSSKKLVGQEELESSTFAVSERHSNQLNYWPINISDFKPLVLLIPESSKRDIQTVGFGLTTFV